MDLERIITWKYKGKMEGINRKAGKAVAAFFAFMALFTLLSRAAVNIITPVVETGLPQRGSLTWKIQAAGTVVENQRHAVFTTGDIRIKQVVVTEGDAVSAGEELIELDLTDLNEKIASKELEIEKTRLTMADLASQKERSEEHRSLALKRAQEDLERITNSAEERVQDALTEKLELEDGMNHYSGDSEKTKELLQLYEVAEQEYRNALREQDEQLLAAERNLEDARVDAGSDSTEQRMSLDMELLQKELEELKKILEAEGIIASPIDGAVKNINVEAGGFTSDTAAMFIADAGAESKFVALIPEEQKKYIEAGDEVILQPYSDRRITGLTVDYIRESKDQERMFEAAVRIPAGQLELGKSATMILEKKSAVYETTIPLSALHADDKGEYVLVVQNTKTVLGMELTAERIDVMIQEKNDTTAALIDGMISGEQFVIIHAEKPVEAKDRVRLSTIE